MTTRPEAFVTYPGLSNHYNYTADLNLLDADTAHLAQSVGQWTLGGTTGAGSVWVPNGGDYGWVHLIAGSDNSFARWRYQVSTAISGSTATFLALVENRNPVARDFILRLVHTGGQQDETVTIPANTTQLVVNQVSGVTSPITELRLQVGADDLTGDEWRCSNIMLAEGTLSSFVPSLRIVGDLEVAIDVDLGGDWGEVDYSLVSRDGASSGAGDRHFSLDNRTANRIRFIRYGDGVANQQADYTTIFPTTGRHMLRVQATASDVTFTLDGGAQQVVAVAEPTVLQQGEQELRVSSTTPFNPLKGNVWSAEVRDGIAGPVVARLNPEEVRVGQVVDPPDAWIQPLSAPGLLGGV